jgi:hypothetical protein
MAQLTPELLALLQSGKYDPYIARWNDKAETGYRGYGPSLLSGGQTYTPGYSQSYGGAEGSLESSELTGYLQAPEQMERWSGIGATGYGYDKEGNQTSDFKLTDPRKAEWVETAAKLAIAAMAGGAAYYGATGAGAAGAGTSGATGAAGGPGGWTWAGQGWQTRPTRQTSARVVV